VLDSRLVFDGVKYIVYRNPEWNKVGLYNVILTRLLRMSGWYMNSGGVVWILPRGNCYFGFSPLTLFRGEIGRSPSHLFDMHVLLRPNENVPHLGDIVLHQMLVQGDLQPIDECSGDYILIAVVYQSNLTLKIVYVALQAPPGFILAVRRWLLFLWNSLREAD